MRGIAFAGARVRSAEVYQDAMAVARETVRRARAKFETIGRPLPRVAR